MTLRSSQIAPSVVPGVRRAAESRPSGALRVPRRAGRGQCRPVTPSRRLLLVHAHPDDETINNGATMARYVAEGAQVTLLTCTLGEEGEVLVPALAQLAADQADQLGGYRISELRGAMEALGGTDWRFLGGPGRYRDSGMMGTPANAKPRAFWNADLDEAVGHAVAVVREVRPQVVVTYDENGGEGHPHPHPGHRVAMAGGEEDAGPPRPHPGPPRRDGGGREGRRPRVPPRPRGAVDGGEGLLVRHAPVGAAGGDRRAEGSRRGDVLR